MRRAGLGLLLGLAGLAGMAAEPGVIVEVPGLWAGFSAGPVARVGGNFSLADLNRDGLPDLLLDQEAWIRGPNAAWSRKVSLPGGDGGGIYDVDRNGILWRIFRDRITGWRLADSGEGWEKVGEQPLEGGNWDIPREEARARRRVLRDLDGDGRDDLVTVTPRGVCWYRGRGEGFDREAGLLLALPETRVLYTARGELWPPEQRVLALPTFRFSCEISLSGEEIAVVYGEESAGGTTWTTLRYPMPRQGSPLKVEAAQKIDSPPLPRDAVPVWLDRGADRPGFARMYWEPDGSGIPGDGFMVCEAWEPGAPDPRVFRRPAPPGAAPYPPLADVNGDGRLDVVMLTVGLARRGPRERAQELLTGSRLLVEVSAWLRQAGGGYARDPSWQGTWTAQLDAPPVRLPRMLGWAARGELASMGGDFNGDGQADLLIRDRLDQAACYPCGAEGCGRQPLFTLPVPPEATVVPADVNGDGVADVLLVPESGNAPTRVFLTGGSSR
ncbi:MAG TPA: VCBS repeat-containing protein [Candidatus Hydrogenedentes bacterium]|nr:VCBS repeat-containing protein [Candidatus Hydrogenedentota bacterium]HOK90216.1 VCBS repeat-containing protein [Candidatus Hydrogenedentota bacterium]